MNQPILLSGTANKPLAQAIAKNLTCPLGEIILTRFSDNEIKLTLLANVRHKKVFILQSTCPPVNDNLLELILSIAAAKKAGAALITAVIPYFGYARQDLSAIVMANILETAGANKILTIDLHSAKIISFFNIPCVNLFSTSIFGQDLKQRNLSKPTIVAPDLGSLTRTKMLAAYVNQPNIAILHKQRDQKNNLAMEQTTTNVQNQTCILVDDIVDTAATICLAAQVLQAQGAAQIIAYCTHPILSGPAIANINNSALTEVVVANTVLLSAAAKHCYKIRQLDIAPLIGAALAKMLTDIGAT